MKKRLRRSKWVHSRSSSQKETRIRTWSGRAPLFETEYPFEPALAPEIFHEALHMNSGPGIRIYQSTVCICTVDTIDAFVLTLLGEQFREFYPGEIPWLSKTTTEMLSAFWMDGNEAGEMDYALTRLALQSFVELDRSISGIYRYRLNVDSVRQAKNGHFVLMGELEQIEDEYTERFPDLSLQRRAFVLICDGDAQLGHFLLNLWHLSLNYTTRAALRDPKRGLAWLSAEDLYVLREETLLKWKQQAFRSLEQKGLLEVRSGRQNKLKYRPHAVSIWKALEALPHELPDSTETDEDFNPE